MFKLLERKKRESIPDLLHAEEPLRMGIRNYLIDGGSGTGKTTVCNELQRRGYQAIHGDRELKMIPKKEASVSGPIPGYDLPPLWYIAKVRALIASHDHAVTFFCGACSNSSEFIDSLDGVFILVVNDLETVMKRIHERVLIDPTDWGATEEEREIVIRAHRTKKAIPEDQVIDATVPVESVVDEILRRVQLQVTS